MGLAADIRVQIGAAITALKPTHLVHVGAHTGEEMPHYRGIAWITLVEPNPELAAALRGQWPGAEVVECACGPQPGRMTLWVPRRTAMASLTPIDGARRVDVAVRRLDEVAPDADVAVVDVQGHELDVLSAAPWESLRAVLVETCTVDDDAMSVLYDDAVAFMAGHGFVETRRWVQDYAWKRRWADGRPSDVQGEIRDVLFEREV